MILIIKSEWLERDICITYTKQGEKIKRNFNRRTKKTSSQIWLCTIFVKSLNCKVNYITCRLLTMTSETLFTKLQVQDFRRGRIQTRDEVLREGPKLEHCKVTCDNNRSPSHYMSGETNTFENNYGSLHNTQENIWSNMKNDKFSRKSRLIYVLGNSHWVDPAEWWVAVTQVSPMAII